MEKTTLYLPEELAVALRETARREGRSQAEIVREALSSHLASLRPAPPRSLGAGQDPGLAGADAEAWFERHLGR